MLVTVFCKQFFKYVNFFKFWLEIKTFYVIIIILNKKGGYNHFAFEFNKALEEITISNTVKTIGISAFAACTNLKSVDFEEIYIPEKIRNYAFQNCEKLENFIIPLNVEIIESVVFDVCNNTKFYCKKEWSINYPFDWNKKWLDDGTAKFFGIAKHSQKICIFNIGTMLL